MSELQSTNPTQSHEVVTVDGGTDLSAVDPKDLVALRAPGRRDILFPAGLLLDENHTPIDPTKDGATTTLDGGSVTTLGGEVIAVSKQ